MMIENQNKEHIEFLREHLEVLTRLKETGYKCDREINDVLSKLHGIVFKQKPSITFGENTFFSGGGNASDKFRLGFVDSYLHKRFREFQPALTPVNDEDRGKGKSTLLLSFCFDEGAMIIVGTVAIAKLYREILEKNGFTSLSSSRSILTVGQLKGRKGSAYIDESVSEKQLQNIRENQEIDILGGFYTT